MVALTDTLHTGIDPRGTRAILLSLKYPRASCTVSPSDAGNAKLSSSVPTSFASQRAAGQRSPVLVIYPTSP